MTYEQLKQFCNSLNPEQLQQEVYLSIVDSNAEKVSSALVTTEDQYYDHTDSLGSLEEIKAENPDDWEDIVADATLCPKGTAVLLSE